MDIERARRVQTVLKTVLSADAEQWPQLIESSCAGDPELRAEVQTLLARVDGARTFLETPPVALAAALIEESERTETPARCEGRRIGAFRITREVGRGGMARVFLAERADGQYEQQVALKLLRPGFDSDVDVERFRAERQILASLNHPHVARLLDGGMTDDGLPYIVLEYVDGEPINRYCGAHELTVRERLELFLNVIDAVEYAHRSSVVHRDLKPSNILVSADGTVKLLDFGVAKILESGLTSEAAPTRTQARWMTPEYAAPEQVRGIAASPRTDVYQLGAVLYELLVGHPPFGERARTTHELEVAVLEDEPAPLPAALGHDLNAIVLTALRKAPDERYPSAVAFAEDIRRYLGGHPVLARRQTLWYRTARLATRRRRELATGGVLFAAVATAFWVAMPDPVTIEPSVAVLPFENLSADAGNDYFSDGLTDEIITRLSAIDGLKVISRTSAMHYKGTRKSLREVGSELKVAHVVEGSVRESNGKVRISAQLVDARDDRQLWAESYEYALSDGFRVQAAIAQAVARALELRLSEHGARQLGRAGTQDPEAAELYQRARHQWSTRTQQGHEQAFALYQKAIERDSSYADAYAGLADAYLTAYQFGLTGLDSQDEIYGRMKWAAERALALNDESADAHTSLATVLLWQRNWPGAEREFRRAIELNPGNGRARNWYGQLLGSMGRVSEALEQSRRAYELDPFAIIICISYAWALYIARDYDQAIEQFRKTLELNQDWQPAYVNMALTYSQQGEHEAAIAAVSRALEFGTFAWPLADAAYVYARAGRKQEAVQLLARAKIEEGAYPGFAVGRAYVGLGEPDSAMAWFERTSWRWAHRGVRADPALDPLRSDPRFVELVHRIDREMGLATPVSR